MAPPSYVDLGKQARDLFGRGYHYGYWKLDCKTKTQSGIEFNTGGQTNTESGKVFGSLETKYKLPDAGVTLSEKWTTDNALFTEVSVQDKLVEGLKLAAVSSFVPHTGSVNAKFKMAYGQEYFKMDADMNLDYRPLINLQAVLGYEGFLLGYQTAFDTEHTKMTTNNFAVGYAAKDFVVHSVVYVYKPKKFHSNMKVSFYLLLFAFYNYFFLTVLNSSYGWLCNIIVYMPFYSCLTNFP